MKNMTLSLKKLNREVEKANEVGGSLYLSGLTSIPEGFNPTVGGSLDLSGLTSIPEGFNPTVGGYLDLRGLTSNYNKLKNGDYVPKRYLYADNILTHIKGKKEIKGYVFYQGKIKGQNVIYDGKNYAHCSNFRDGVADLLFKNAADRGAEQYRGMSLDTVLTLEEAKTMYRIITGACKQGTEMFIQSLGDKLKDKYTIKEAIELTNGQYNSERFKEFFE